jgi:hypothetical protein
MICSGEHGDAVGAARARLDSRTLTQLQPAIEAELRTVLASRHGGLLPSPFNLDVLEHALARVLAPPRSPDERRRYLLFVGPLARRLLLAHSASSQRANSHPDPAQIDRWLARLESFDPLSALMIDLRYFAGLSVRTTASVVGVSAPTVIRDMRFAKAWLAAYLGEPLRPRW